MPHVERAVVDPAKLRDYLLSRRHPVGRSKAMDFASIGYFAEAWQALAADLRSQHLPVAPDERIETEYGAKYVIRASLTGPSGTSAPVVSVWVVLAGEDFPRFVTAYPGGVT